MSGFYSISVDFLGLHPRQILTRPRDVPCPTDHAVIDLTSHMSRRLAVARTILHDDESADRLEHRLTAWWSDVSAIIAQYDFTIFVREQLKQGSPAERDAAWWWMSGQWHDNRVAMDRLLWRISCCPILVSGAHDLHLRVERAREGSHSSARVC